MPSDPTTSSLDGRGSPEPKTLGDVLHPISEDDSEEMLGSGNNLPETHQTRPIVPPQRFEPTLVDGALHLPRDSEDAPASSRYPFLQPPEKPNELGRLGNYRILRLLGKGGMGFVFLAEDIGLGRQVALKVMKPNLAKDPAAGQRFLREARTLAAIKHEHLVAVYQVGQEGQIIYLAMEWLQGETVEDWIVRLGPADVADIVRIALQISKGMVAIHRAGVVHRDVKPSNLWLEKPHQQVRILDFGLARPIDDEANFTQTGLIVGTPAYMSPEQARGAKIDARSDIFSLGGVLYFMCTGVRPFDTENTMAMLTALAVYDPKPIQDLNPEIPGVLSNLIMQMLQKNVDRRPASAEALVAQLKRIEAIGAQTEVMDFAGLDMPDDDADSSLLSTPKLKSSSGGGRLHWAVAIGSIALLFLGAVILGIALMKSRPSSESTAQQAQEQQSKAPTSKEKKAPTTIVQVKPKTAFLSELKPIDSDKWYDRVPMKGKDMNDAPRPKGYEGVKVNGQVSPHGIFMHAALPEGGTSSISYSIGKQYDLFQATVSINDGPPRSETPLTFAVYGDGKKLWQSEEIQKGTDAQECKVSIKNIDVLKIEVDCPGDPRAGHAVWIEPRVVVTEK